MSKIKDWRKGSEAGIEKEVKTMTGTKKNKRSARKEQAKV